MTEHISAAEYRDMMAGKKPSKYRNVRTEVDGIKFDSKAEANRYCELKLLMQSRDVKVFIRQPHFLLQEGFVKDDERFEKLEYVADFLVIYMDGRVEVEDVKGRRTREYINKRKLFERRYPQLKIVEVRA